MIRASGLSFLAGTILLLLLLLPMRARSQSCFGIAPFSEGPLRLGVSRAKPGNNEVRTGHVAFGEFDGVFVDASYSTIKPLSGPETDVKGHQYGVLTALDWHVPGTSGWYFCPTLAAQAGRRNSVFLAPQPPASARTDDRFLVLGGAAAPSSGIHDGVVTSPTAGVWFGRDRSSFGAAGLTREYGVYRVGVGVVILKRYTVLAVYEREFATAAALPGFALIQASIDIGR